jgi:L-threonylcarbamoyladenylate synthase
MEKAKEGVVALPTETVYGLAAKIDSPEAIQQIFRLKQRPLNYYLIVHIANAKDIYMHTSKQPPYLSVLVKAFWPSPLTIILKKKLSINNLIIAGQDTVAIRMPKHEAHLKIISATGTVAPSANQYCQTSPTNAKHVEMGLGEELPVFDGGIRPIGIESTIIDVTNDNEIILLRPGIISPERIAEISKVKCNISTDTKQKFLGSHKKHYASKKPIVLINNIEQLSDISTSYCMLLSNYNHNMGHHIITIPNNPEYYATQLYEHWHKASSMNIKYIVIEKPPKNTEGYGTHNRINKAAHRDE